MARVDLVVIDITPPLQPIQQPGVQPIQQPEIQPVQQPLVTLVANSTILVIQPLMRPDV